MKVEVDIRARKHRVPGQIVDVSGGGCRIEMAEPVAPGDLLRVILHGHDDSTHVALGAEVRWACQAADGDLGWIAACRFTGTTALLAGKILGFVSSGLTVAAFRALRHVRLLDDRDRARPSRSARATTPVRAQRRMFSPAAEARDRQPRPRRPCDPARSVPAVTITRGMRQAEGHRTRRGGPRTRRPGRNRRLARGSGPGISRETL